MKSFELWRQKKGSFLYDMQEDHATDEIELIEEVDLPLGGFKSFGDYETLEEASVRSLVSKFKSGVRKIVAKVKSLFKLDQYKWGQSKKMKFSIPLPAESQDIYEKVEGASGSTRFGTGPQVEAYCLKDIALRINELGFNVEIKLNGNVLGSLEEVDTHIQSLQNDIEAEKLAQYNNKKLGVAGHGKKKRDAKGKLVKPIPKNKYLQGVRHAQLIREAQGQATGEQMVKSIESALTTKKFDRRADFTVTVNNGGMSGRGSTKADIDVEVRKSTESEHKKAIKEWRVSHKYNWDDETLGTQSSVWSFPYLVINGVGATGKGSREILKGVVCKAASRYFGGKNEAEEQLDRLAYLHKSGKPKDQKEFTEISERYFTFLVALVKKKENKNNLLKLMGFEKNLHHFMVLGPKSVGKQGSSVKNIASYSSIGSKEYKEKFDKVYSEDAKVKIEPRLNPTSKTPYEIAIFISYFGEPIFDTVIFAKSSPQSKNDDSVDIKGIGTGELGAASFTKRVIPNKKDIDVDAGGDLEQLAQILQDKEEADAQEKALKAERSRLSKKSGLTPVGLKKQLSRAWTPGREVGKVGKALDKASSKYPSSEVIDELKTAYDNLEVTKNNHMIALDAMTQGVDTMTFLELQDLDDELKDILQTGMDLQNQVMDIAVELQSTIESIEEEERIEAEEIAAEKAEKKEEERLQALEKKQIEWKASLDTAATRARNDLEKKRHNFMVKYNEAIARGGEDTESDNLKNQLEELIDSFEEVVLQREDDIESGVKFVNKQISGPVKVMKKELDDITKSMKERRKQIYQDNPLRGSSTGATAPRVRKSKVLVAKDDPRWRENFKDIIKPKLMAYDSKAIRKQMLELSYDEMAALYGF